MAIIITDSTSDLTYKEAEALGIEMLSLTVNFGEEHYKDKIDLSNETFYEKLETCSEIPTTSLLNPADFLETYEKYENEEIIVITLSPKLSGTYQSAVIAKDMSEREDIYVVDSGSVTIPQGLLVKMANKMNQEGMSAKEIVSKLEELKEKVRLVAVIDTLKYLIKGGRLSSVQGAIGTALRLKPIIAVKDGEILTLSKARGTKAAFKEVLKLIQEDGEVDESLPISFAHSNNEAMLQEFISAMPYKGDTYMIGSVVGTHAGPGAVAIAYFVK